MLGSSKQIAELQEKISKLEADLVNSTEGSAALTKELSQARNDLQTALDKSLKLEAEVTDFKTKLETADKLRIEAEDKAKKAEASITDQVNTRLAAAGVDPIKRDPAAAEKDDGNQKTDASLPPRQRAAAAMKGFKVFKK